MQSGNEESFLNPSKQSILLIFFALVIVSLIAFKNLFFKQSILLKNFGELSVDPEIAFTNNKPTFLEFYAEWCEVCQEMAPKVDSIKEELKEEINFVFLNVDNPKWVNYIKKYNVNGIPQVNLFDSKSNLKHTFIGKQDEQILKESLLNLDHDSKNKLNISSADFSLMREKNNYQFSPRSHG